MLELERVERAVTAIEECCSHCELCSPDCPISVAHRAMDGLLYDLREAYEEKP